MIKKFSNFSLNETEKIELAHWLKGYEDYEHGNPQKAAEDLIKAKNEFLKKAKAALDEAGPWLSPGIQQALIRDVKKALEDIPYKH